MSFVGKAPLVVPIYLKIYPIKILLGTMRFLHWNNSKEGFVGCLGMPRDWRPCNSMDTSPEKAVGGIPSD